MSPRKPTNLGEDDLHNQEGTGDQRRDLENKITHLRSLQGPGREHKLKTGKQELPSYRYDPPVAQPYDRVGQQQHKKSEESQDLLKENAIRTSQRPSVLVPVPGTGRTQPPSSPPEGLATQMGPEVQRDGLGDPSPTPSYPRDTHKYVEERGLKIVLEDFALQVLLNAILGLERREETRQLSSALIRKC